MRMKAGRAGLSVINFGTFAAFLAWFGAPGYLLERFSNVWVYLGLFVRDERIGRRGIIFWFPEADGDGGSAGSSRLRHDRRAGQIASPIRKNGTGEVHYARAGSRKASWLAAKTEIRYLAVPKSW
jgi:hypothetical protein